MDQEPKERTESSDSEYDEPLDAAQKECLVNNTRFCIESGIAVRYTMVMAEKAQEAKSQGDEGKARRYLELSRADLPFAFSVESGPIAEWGFVFRGKDEPEENYYYRELYVYRNDPELAPYFGDALITQTTLANSVGEEPFKLYDVFDDLDAAVINAAFALYDQQVAAGLDEMDFQHYNLPTHE